MGYARMVGGKRCKQIEVQSHRTSSPSCERKRVQSSDMNYFQAIYPEGKIVRSRGLLLTKLVRLESQMRVRPHHADCFAISPPEGHLFWLLFIALTSLALAGCPNRCSGHGRCVGQNCQCFPTWTGSPDCSIREIAPQSMLARIGHCCVSSNLPYG